MSNPRVRKIADRIQVIVAEMLERRIKDPRLGFVTVTDVRVSGDTQQATIFYTVLGEDADLASSAAALESAKGLVRSEVGKQLGMRHVPTQRVTSTRCSPRPRRPMPPWRRLAGGRRTPARQIRIASRASSRRIGPSHRTRSDLTS